MSTPQNALFRPPAVIAVLGAVLALFVFSAALSAHRKPMSQGFDEVAQVSYIAQMQSTPQLRSDLNRLRLLDPQTFRFTDQPNYLNHPSFYYLVLAQSGPILAGHPDTLQVFRLLNVLMAGLGFAAVLAIGLAARFDRLQLYAYVVPLFCIPVLPLLAGSVNNDNGAFLGGMLLLIGVFRWLDTHRRDWLFLALAGTLIAAWSKLTGFLLGEGLLAVVSLYLIVRRRMRPDWAWGVILTSIAAALPYIVFVAQYGSPAPATEAQTDLLTLGAQSAGWAASPRLSPLAYGAYFTSEFIAAWMPSLVPRNAFQYAMLAIPVAALLCAAAGIWVSARKILRREERSLDVVIVAGAVAIAATFACHIAFSYERHLATGWMMDAYPRYYLPMAAIIPLAGLSAASIPRGTALRRFMLAFLIAGPMLFLIFGVPLRA